MNRWNKATAAGILAAVLAASSLAGCGSAKGTDTALVINGENVSLGTVEMMTRYQQAETTSLLTMYGLAQQGSVWASQYSAATSTEEAQTFGQNLKKDVKDKFVQEIVLKQHAEEFGVSIPESLEADMAAAADENFAANQAAYEAQQISRDDVYKMLELQTIEALMRKPMVAETDRNVSDEEAKQSSISYARISLTTTNSENAQEDVSDADKKVYKSQMEELISQLKKAEDTAAADMSSYANAINDQIAVTTYSYGTDYTLPDAVIEAASKLKDGEICEEVIDTGDYYYVVRMDHVFDEEATQTKKDSIISEREQTIYETKLKEWTDAAEVEEKKPFQDLEVSDKNGFTVKQQESN
ncbi:MAG: peptidylprolyl isomerase [Eubacteriales bacterium]|nr:peptidylprolyl isomerase [Eubacteriales bacterium]